jgi:hypothetical protein
VDAKNAIVNVVNKQHRHINVDKLDANASTLIMAQQHPQISSLIIFSMKAKN